MIPDLATHYNTLHNTTTHCNTDLQYVIAKIRNQSGIIIPDFSSQNLIVFGSFLCNFST